MNGGSSQEQLMEMMRRMGAASPEQALDWARRMPPGATGDALASQPPQHVVFHLGSVECALPRDVVRSVELVPQIASVPNLADWVLGVVQVRGEILSVVDLRRFFGQAGVPITAQSRLIVAHLREMVIGFLVDQQPEMRALTNGRLNTERASIPPWAQLYAQGTISAPDRVIVVLDPEALLYGEKMHHYRADML